MIFGIKTTSDISKLFYIISRAVRRVKFWAILPNLKYNSCYYLFTLQPKKFSHLTLCFYFVELFPFVGDQIGFEVLVFGPAGPDIEPGRCTFLNILVFRIFFSFMNLLISKSITESFHHFCVTRATRLLGDFGLP